MRYLSVCSGIEAATVAWHALDWQPIGFSEVEAFPSAVLRHHYPAVPNFGDMTQFERWPNADVDVLVGGTPCQSFSVAGLRKGLDDPRGNLMLTFGAIANRFRPKWLVWENVPGVLSSNGGRDFGTFLGMLGELGYGFAYRVLDAQYFGVAQRRRRVFVIGCLGNWRSAAAVLFERYSLSGDTAPSREKREAVAKSLTSSTSSGQRYDGETEAFVTHSLRGEGFDASEDGIGRGTPLIPVSFNARQDPVSSENSTGSLDTDGHTNAVAYSVRMANTSSNGWGVQENVTHTLDSTNGPAVAVSVYQDSEYGVAEYPTAGSLRAGRIPEHQMVMQATAAVATGVFFAGQGAKAGSIAYDQHIALTLKASDSGTNRTPSAHIGMQVRRLTPVECERLQGFPDNYTAIPWRGKAETPDGPRYKALGNSMAVPVMRWIGNRIALVDQLLQSDRNNSLYSPGNGT